MFFHVDINSYFATMLQQENPALRGKPIGVVKGVGRSCIIASSNEAKTFGVKTGCRVREARLLCPIITLVPANFDLCLASTRKLKELFHHLCPHVDIFSLDEAFLNMTGCEILMRQLLHSSPPLGGGGRGRCSTLEQQFGHLIQSRIKEMLGTWYSAM
ncbi:hypothetical protein C5B42_00965 [Candidatus Cerribacteria bacterium 'Amazon FNV 2010 28 9']|uniref:UmuC domain-containing protein n=1 Tax=Candidatus Cerribacteria bacterium 'Amazon FNV 2010 28 9' TaxID=2081795 RepID=A0A317JQA2_9BACT|nr:MAG: hypothetical protein C5B42_00965 [Candidatus Cerribacteria bacterium 'Amazon FNV 2010 28 9']